MSNLIYNGNFALPAITTNSYIYTNTFTTAQSNAFYWISPSSNVALQNGNTAFNVTPPTAVSATQYIIIQNTGTFQQLFTVTQLGYYTISFNYATRPGYVLNNMKIYLNGTLFDTVTTTPTNWSLYSNSTLSPILGTNTLLLQGTTNLKVFYGQIGGITTNNNSNK
jgi:hypothetical protein